MKMHQMLMQVVGPLVQTDGLTPRVFPLVMPQGQASFPCAVYSVVSAEPLNDLSGLAGATRYRVQLDVYGKVWLDTHELAGAIQQALDMQDELQCVALGRQDFHEDDTRLFRASLEFSIWEISDE